MATHKSALKRIRQNEKRRRRNVHIRSLVKSRIRKVREAMESRDMNAAKGALSAAVREINKARSKGVLHRNTASRKVSRLTRAVNTLATT